MECLRIDNRTISTPVFDIIQDIKKCLHNGKLAVIKSPVGDNIRVSCPNPNHKGGHEAKPSADIYIGPTTDKIKYATFHCFTCGMVCSFEHFVAMCFECSDDKAKEWLKENYADGTIENSIELPEMPFNIEHKSYLDESILENFQNFHPYMVKRKLAKNIIELFKVKYDPKSRCLVFPVYDEHNKLVMLTRRSVEDKTFIIDKNKEKPLYLLNYIIEHNITSVIITEGQIDALTSCSYGFPAVATMGAVSEHQIDLLNKSGIRILYLFFDNDDAGRRFTDKVLNKLRKDILPIFVKVIIPGKKDINDLSQDEFYQCIENAEKSFDL